jgi:hypothetical protein
MNQSEYLEVQSAISPEIFKITSHARDRFAERFGYDVDIIDIIKHCMPFGGQKGDGRLYISADNRAVVAAKKNGKHVYVTTVLTLNQAINNMQQLGLISSSVKYEDLQELYALAAKVRLEEQHNQSSQKLKQLAEEHFKKCYAKQQRNKILRELGYDVEGEDGNIYRKYLKEYDESFNRRKKDNR